MVMCYLKKKITGGKNQRLQHISYLDLGCIIIHREPMKSYFRNWNSLTRGALYNFNKLLKYVNVIQFDYARNSSIMDAARMA